MAQISRRELKSDEFVSGMDAAYEYYLQHQKSIITIIIIVAVVACLGYGFFAWRQSRNQKASAMLAQALNTLHAPISTAGAAATPGTPSFTDAKARGAAAAQQFQAVVGAYGSTSVGRLAHYYLGLAELDEKTPAASKKAEADLQAASSSSDATVAAAAKHALANLAIQNGDLAKAHALLLALTQQDSPTMPRAVALLELASLDRTYKPKEAATYYHQLETQYPNTSTAALAQKQLADLKQ
ncbi:MAG: tetratricopeptide repeat protein [Terriglobales bacterium]